MKGSNKKPKKSRIKKSFKKRFTEAVERDKKSMYTESDREFLKKLLDMVDEQNKER